MVLGIAAATGAATLYSLGFAIQAIDAKQAPHEEHLRLALAWNLIRRGRWLAGSGLSLLGWPLQITAVLLAPLVVVQPTLAVGLLVLLFFAQKILGEHAGRYEHVAMGAIMAGIIGAGLTAPHLSTSYASERLPIMIIMGALAIASILPYLLRLIGHTPTIVTMVSAGMALAWCGVATKLVADALAHGHPIHAIFWGISAAIAAGVGALSEMSALQSRPAIQVAPVSIVTQTVIPIMLAPLLFGEHFNTTPLEGIPLTISLVVLVAGAAMLARSPLLLALMEKQAHRTENSQSIKKQAKRAEDSQNIKEQTQHTESPQEIPNSHKNTRNTEKP